MTASAAALPWGAGVPKTGVRSATILPPTPSRQAQARNQMLYVVAAFAGLAVLATAQQVIAKGWQAFVFRPPGVGGSPPLDEDSKDTSASTTPAAEPAATSTPTSTHYSFGHRHGHHTHHFTRTFTEPTVGVRPPPPLGRRPPPPGRRPPPPPRER